MRAPAGYRSAMRKPTVAILLGLAALPASASASAVSAPNGQVLFLAGVNERNRVTVVVQNGQIVVGDGGSSVTAGPGCVPQGNHEARCGVAPGTANAVRIQMGDQDDTANTAIPAYVAGGAGNDTIRSTSGGGAILEGGGGLDELRGGPGPDTLRDNDGRTAVDSDILDGGAGRDRVLLSDRRGGVRVDLRLTGKVQGAKAENDQYSSIESVRGTPFADYLSGDDGANTLDGGGGSDRIFGRAGNDVLRASHGRVDGGRGFDRVFATPHRVTLVRVEKRTRKFR